MGGIGYRIVGPSDIPRSTETMYTVEITSDDPGVFAYLEHYWKDASVHHLSAHTRRYTFSTDRAADDVESTVQFCIYDYMGARHDDHNK